MKIVFEEAVPIMRIYNNEEKPIEFQVSHDGEYFSSSSPAYRGMTKTFYKVKCIDITESDIE